MTDPEKEQLWNCISKMRSMPWRKPRGGEHNWDYRALRGLFNKLVVYGDNQQPTAAWRLLNSDPYKYMIYPWYKSQLYNCITFTPAATYQISPNDGSIPEGGNLLFSVVTTNVADGVILYWTILPLAPTPAVAGDFVGGVMDGSVTINVNAGSDTIFTVDNILYTPNTTFAIQVRTGSIAGPVVATSNTFTIDRGAAPLRTVWDNISNVPVVDPNDVSQWQNFYDLGVPGLFGVPFASVVVVGNTVDIYPGSSAPYGTATLPDGIFFVSNSLVEFIDFGGWIYTVGISSFNTAVALQKIYLPGPISSFGIECLLNAGIITSTVPGIGTYPDCVFVGQSAFQQTPLFSELYLPNAVTVELFAFVFIYIEVLDFSAFIYPGSGLITTYYTLDTNKPLAVCTVHASWTNQVLTATSMESDYVTATRTKYIFKFAGGIQYGLDNNSGFNIFPNSVPTNMWFMLGGPDLTPFSITYYFEITGTGITQADFIQPNPISGTFIPQASGVPFIVEPDLSAVGKGFTFSVYEGTDNTGPLVISKFCQIT